MPIHLSRRAHVVVSKESNASRLITARVELARQMDKCPLEKIQHGTIPVIDEKNEYLADFIGIYYS